jgi:hypothetical protein
MMISTNRWAQWTAAGLFLVILSLLALPGGIQAQSPTYAMVDTGQTACYDNTTQTSCPSSGTAFYGQDAQHTSNAPSYTTNGNGTVTDNVTGLMWQQSADTNGDKDIDASDKLTYTEAGTYCANLAMGGYTDWRLPNIKTLYSLILFSGADPSGFSGTDTSSLTPFIDDSVFDFAYGDTDAGERIIDSQYASSTKYVSTTMNGDETMFGVNFADGRIKGYGLTPFGADKTFFVMCVRGNTSYGQNSFVDNEDGTITDDATGLMWAQDDSGTALNWEVALNWVQTLNTASYLGYDDWRLPNAKELQSIVDYSRSPDTSSTAAIDPIFNTTQITNEDGAADWPWYWSSTTHANYVGMGDSGAYVAFGRAGGWQKLPPTASCYTLMDVHGAGAQRSDPKTSAWIETIGIACTGETAYGRGPQGDVQRAANYVRIVRDTSASEATPTPLDGEFETSLPIIQTAVPETTPTHTIQQTLSDKAQCNTIAFDALAFLTGSLGADSFFPPGMCDFLFGIGESGEIHDEHLTDPTQTPSSAAPPGFAPDRGAGPRPQPPAEAVAACQQAEPGTVCQFTSPHGVVEGTCRPGLGGGQLEISP